MPSEWVAFFCLLIMEKGLHTSKTGRPEYFAVVSSTSGIIISGKIPSTNWYFTAKTYYQERGDGFNEFDSYEEYRQYRDLIPDNQT